MSYKADLLAQNKKIFKTDDLALIWKIKNRNTLLTTIKRYLNKQVLFSLRKGLYSLVPPNELDPYLLGTAYVKGFCYVSLQSVLAQHGLINQQPTAITLIGPRSQDFSIAEQRYLCHKMKSEYLHNLTGIELQQEYPQATLIRAIADMLYYNRNFYFDRDIKIYSDQLKLIQQQVFINSQ